MLSWRFKLNFYLGGFVRGHEFWLIFGICLSSLRAAGPVAMRKCVRRNDDAASNFIERQSTLGALNNLFILFNGSSNQNACFVSHGNLDVIFNIKWFMPRWNFNNTSASVPTHFGGSANWLQHTRN